MKKIVVISASARRQGNSDLLCDEFIKGAKESNHEVEKIFLGDYKIGSCIGCESCYQTSVCYQKDNMKEFLNKMIEAQIIVMATPTYFYTMNGQMKTFIDRIVSRYKELVNKEFYFIITAWDNDQRHLKRVVEEFRGFTDCLDNPIEKGIVYGVGVGDKGEIKSSPAMKQCYQLGKNA